MVATIYFDVEPLLMINPKQQMFSSGSYGLYQGKQINSLDVFRNI